MELEEKINRLTDNKYGFTFKNAVLDSSTAVCSVEFYYNDGTLLTQDVKDLCQSIVTDFLPRGYTYNITYIKNFISEESISSFVNNYLKTNCASISYTLDKVVSQEYHIYLTMDSLQEGYIKDKKVVQNLIAALKQHFDVEFNVFIEYVDNMIDFSKVDEPTGQIEETTTKYIEVSNTESVYGESIDSKATYIRDSKNIGRTVCVCGYVRDFKKTYTKPKTKDGQNTEELEDYFSKEVPMHERKEAGQRARYKFSIEDFTATMPVFMYASIDQVPLLDKLDNGKTVIVIGEIVEDKFNEDISLKPKQISLCTLPSKWEEEIDYKTEKSFYEFVTPEDMVYTDQVGFFNLVEQRQVAPYLQNHDVVVFDFETTGLNPYAGDKIIEIGAVKIVNGAIVQKFQSYIDPEMKIPEESFKIHHISQDMVVGKPKAHQVLQDFYKFTRGCVLTGYNVDFDLGFLIKQGKESRYNFDNPKFDIYKDLAQKYIKGGVKNYKLGTIAKHLGVVLDNAHSAFYDTVATAEVLIKLADNLPADFN